MNLAEQVATMVDASGVRGRTSTEIHVALAVTKAQLRPVLRRLHQDNRIYWFRGRYYGISMEPKRIGRAKNFKNRASVTTGFEQTELALIDHIAQVRGLSRQEYIRRAVCDRTFNEAAEIRRMAADCGPSAKSAETADQLVKAAQGGVK